MMYFTGYFKSPIGILSVVVDSDGARGEVPQALLKAILDRAVVPRVIEKTARLNILRERRKLALFQEAKRALV